MPPTRERRWWTSQEDDILKREVQGKSTNLFSPLLRAPPNLTKISIFQCAKAGTSKTGTTSPYHYQAAPTKTAVSGGQRSKSTSEKVLGHKKKTRGCRRPCCNSDASWFTTHFPQFPISRDSSLLTSICRRWSQVGAMVQSRNADRKQKSSSSTSHPWFPSVLRYILAVECAKRWQHVLGPDVKHCSWTPEEDRKLLDAMSKFGNNWKQIGLTELPDRSTHDLRNRQVEKSEPSSVWIYS